MISDGSDPAWRGGKVLHLVLHQVLHHPTRRAAPAAKKGGSLPSFPSPLARLGSAGSGRKTRRETPDNGRRQWYTPHRVLWYTPPSDRVPFRAAPTATPASTPERSRQQVNITFVIPPPRTPAQRNAGAGRVGRFRPHRRCGRRRAARRQDHERRAVPGVRQRTASARRSGTGRKRRTIPARSSRRHWPTSCKTRSRRPMPALVCLQCSYVSPFSGRWRRAEGNLSALIAF